LDLRRNGSMYQMGVAADDTILNGRPI
jgi:hypothetical protein